MLDEIQFILIKRVIFSYVSVFLNETSQVVLECNGYFIDLSLKKKCNYIVLHFPERTRLGVCTDMPLNSDTKENLVKRTRTFSSNDKSMIYHTKFKAYS